MENNFVIVGHISGLTAIRIAAIKAEFPDIVIVKQDDVQNLEEIVKENPFESLKTFKIEPVMHEALIRTETLKPYKPKTNKHFDKHRFKGGR